MKKSPAAKSAPQREKKRYSVTVEFNDTKHSFRTNDIGEAIMKVKPIFIKTRVKLTVKDGKKVSERYLFVEEARRMWRSPVGMFATLHRLIFK